ncbi:MAG: ABC transporter permease [Lewinellaceae bacterium]|nr:ABC transporter permease [Lewinellaceae bacterium]
MKQFIKLAWRNLWRNRRRTLLTLASVFMAVVLSIAIRSLQLGVYANMIGNSVRFSTGYLQIHAKGYWEDQTINNAFLANAGLDSLLVQDPDIALSVPRLESFALASSGQHTKGIAVSGIDPAKEDAMNGLAGKLIQGQYFESGSDQGVLMGDMLARYLQLEMGDTLVLLGQGYHGATAAGQFRVRGIFHFPIEQINGSIVYLALPDAQALFGAPDMLSSMSLMPRGSAFAENTRRQLESSLGDTWEVLPWQTMNKSLVQEIQGDNAGGIIMLGILYVVVAFGVFSTVLMMAMERKKEFAVMVAIGMKRWKLALIVLLETFFIGVLGVVLGGVLIYPLLYQLHEHPIKLTGTVAETYHQMGMEPIMPASLDPQIIITQGLTVLLIAFLSATYPIWYIQRFSVPETIKS